MHKYPLLFTKLLHKLLLHIYVYFIQIISSNKMYFDTYYIDFQTHTAS